MTTQALSLFSNLILSLYRAAQEMPVDKFQDSAMVALKACLPFDSSMWGQGVVKQSGLDIHSIHLHNSSPEMLMEYEKVKTKDTTAALVASEPRHTIGINIREYFDEPHQADIRDFCAKFGHENILITGDAHPTTRFVQWISLYRKDVTQLCTEDEIQILGNLAPHLMQALTINRKIHLENTFGDVAREKWSVAIADSRGYYYHADPQFKELVRSEWRDSADDVLASALLHALTGGDRRVVGRKVVVKSRLEHGLWYLRVRQREKVDSLTPRELQVARLLLSGLSRKEVANSLHRTEATIQTQTRSIYSKLGIQSVVLLAKHLALAE